MTSLCPRCRLRVRVPRLVPGEDPLATEQTCRVCGKVWQPYGPSEQAELELPIEIRDHD